MLHRTYESFKESNDIRDLAWLYFLHFSYDGVLPKSSWSKDNRMGVLCDDSMKKFESKGLVIIDESYYRSTNDAYDIIIEKFGSSSMEDAFNKSINLIAYKEKDKYNGYPINKIPIELWRNINPEEDEVLDNWSDFFTSWWNTNGSDNVLKNWIRKNGENNRKMVNEYHLREYFYPESLPKEIILYRGLKSEFKNDYNKGYTSWTLDLEQGKRFAKYHFSQGYTSKPDESKIQILLEAHLKIEDIVMFIGGDEHEVILKEPVELYKMRKLK